MSPPAARPGPALTPAGITFFSSGFAALVYQVGWQRILALHTGVGLYSIAMIVGSFMAGLGIGHRWGGVLSPRLSRGRALLAFSGIELGIACWGALSRGLYYDLFTTWAPWLYAPAWRGAIVHLLTLLPPTLFMGMSFPLLVRGLVRRAGESGRTIGHLYGMNVLGAASGALLTPWVLIRNAGVPGALWVAVAANAVAALGGLLLAVRAQEGDEEALPDEPGNPGDRKRPWALWLALYSLSGFLALSLELLWFRVMDIAVKSTPFTFGSVLSLYLLGSGLGSLLGAGLVGRIRNPLRAFLLAQSLLLAYAGSAVLALAFLPETTPLYSWFFQYWQGQDAFNLGAAGDVATLLGLYVVLPALLYGPSTVLMGLSFPILQRAVQDDAQTSGRKVGFLQAANVAGCVLGVFLTGLVLLDLLGLCGSLRLVMASGLVFVLVAVVSDGWEPAFAAVGAALMALILVLPSSERLWLRLHGQRGGSGALVEEGASGLAALVPDGPRGWALSVNGRFHSWVPYGGVHSLLGALPAILHPAPRDVAIVGLGSGDTAWGAGCRQETRSITIFEIVAPEPRLLARLVRETRPGGPALRTLEGFLADPRVRMEFVDGRNALLRSRRAYDLIQGDPLHPNESSSGNLYSVEYFALCAARLRPGGLMCSWAPTERSRRSFRSVFPHVLLLEGGSIVVGAREPLVLDPGAWSERLRSPAVLAYLGQDVAQQVRKRLKAAELARPLEAGQVSLDEDLFPRDEFRSPD